MYPNNFFGLPSTKYFSILTHTILKNVYFNLLGISRERILSCDTRAYLHQYLLLKREAEKRGKIKHKENEYLSVYFYWGKYLSVEIKN